jgi:hypothetical protein
MNSGAYGSETSIAENSPKSAPSARFASNGFGVDSWIKDKAVMAAPAISQYLRPIPISLLLIPFFSDRDNKRSAAGVRK